MADRRKRRRLDPAALASWAEQCRSDLPADIPISLFEDVCSFELDDIPVSPGWGCDGDNHSLTATKAFICQKTELDWREADILAFLERIGGRCDCSVRSKARKRLARLIRIWDEWDAGEHFPHWPG